MRGERRVDKDKRRPEDVAREFLASLASKPGVSPQPERRATSRTKQPAGPSREDLVGEDPSRRHGERRS